MPLAEIADRSRQETSKWLERLGVAGAHTWENTAPQPSAGADDAVLPSDRFFDGAIDEGTLFIHRRHLTAERDRVLAEAGRICGGHFHLLGYRDLRFGTPIDWHLDPVSGRRSPLQHWSRFDVAHPLPGGDARVVWELNRHQWMVRLAQAWFLSRDDRYASIVRACLIDWMDANPPGLGINWASSLEVALRIISWCWTLSLLRRSDQLEPSDIGRIVHGIRLQACHVEKHLSIYSSPNTHLTGEALGLLYAGTLFPKLKESERWRELSSRILIEQLEEQVLSDGVYREQSTWYQRYTAEIYLHYLVLSEKNEEPAGTAARRRVESMFDYLLAVRRPDGGMPEIGDADGGHLMPLARRHPSDAGGEFSTAAALFGRADFRPPGAPAPETVWLLGTAGWRACLALEPSAPSVTPSRVFGEGGCAVLSSGWNREAHQLILDAGPLGCPISAAHGHADLLSVQCSVFGEACIVDPGTFAYASGPIWRDHFRSAAAHSTLGVDGAEPATPDGAFSWRTRPCARLSRWDSDETIDVVDAHHDAFSDARGPVVHRRRVLFVKPRYWVVVDDLWGPGIRRLHLRYQFAPSVSLESVGTSLFRVRLPSGRGLMVGLYGATRPEIEIQRGQLEPIRGWFSPGYGQLQPAPRLRLLTTMLLPARLVTLLLPTRRPDDPPPEVTVLRSAGSSIDGIVLGSSGETIRFDDCRISIDRGLQCAESPES